MSYKNEIFGRELNDNDEFQYLEQLEKEKKDKEYVMKDMRNTMRDMKRDKIDDVLNNIENDLNNKSYNEIIDFEIYIENYSNIKKTIKYINYVLNSED